MSYKLKPLRVICFDINNTLDVIGQDKSVKVVIPTRHVFSKLRRNPYNWVGVTSGMNDWMSLQILNSYGIPVDFSVNKSELKRLKESIIKFHKCDNILYLHVGDDDSDVNAAKKGGWEFMYADEFMNKFNVGVFD